MIIAFVRSLRVTDDTWKALGIAAECFGMSRADYLEQVIRGNASPSITWKKGLVNQAKTTVAELATTPLSVATLETVRDQVLLQLKLGKQAPGYIAHLRSECFRLFVTLISIFFLILPFSSPLCPSFKNKFSP
ncbi:hypothetical protein G7B40_035195 [Aetokthonos hydrillicola Thurmond2011]|uniref:Uncharacterized protein n=1 Tax=Aetokthonos hydrillicola Thurmond2011 TaxID=2712845 RepID=A0AAP5M923_9CYAN|nr:hypothetical protein [Aetokthonos hydrillicola]MDR9899766.1 hypothetical protein [Aetokthonos hydrillicola Thurmond2011]